MATNSYHFVDRWFIRHPIESVWEKIIAADQFPQWWGEVYTEVRPLNELLGDQVGSRAAITAHGFLPYTIRFVAEITEVAAPQRLGLKADGDLTGKGLWTLAPIDGGTQVIYEWIVQADKLILRLFSPVIKPVFEANHRWTMRKGELALNRLLDAASREA